MLDIYMLTRIAVAQDICCLIFGLGILYWIVAGSLKLFSTFDDDLADILHPVSYQLRKARHVVMAAMLLGFFGMTLLPDKTAVSLMVGKAAADNVTAAIEAK